MKSFHPTLLDEPLRKGTRASSKLDLILFVVSLVFIASNCTKIEPEKVLFAKNNKAQLALYCFLTPADSIFAEIKQTRSVGDVKKAEPSPKNAIVTIKDIQTNNSNTLTYSEQNRNYGCSQKTIPVIPGHSYIITVNVQGFTSLKSSCLIPSSAAVIDNNIFYGPVYSDNGTYSIERRIRRVELKWKNISDKTQSYNFFVIETFDYFQNNKFSNFESLYIDEKISKEGDLLFLNTETLESKTPHTFYLFTAEQSLFKYLKMAEGTREVLLGGGADFFGAYQGIVPSYSNVEGGYGIFGSYLKTSKTVEFK